MSEEERNRLRADFEAVLFTMGEAVEEETLCKALGIEKPEFDELVSSMEERYGRPDSGLSLIRLENAYQLCTKKECYPALIRVASEPKRPVLTEVMLEVLSIVSYKQPVTRGEIERIRGVSSDYSVNRLLEYGLIEECGRQESPGRPILFGTTEEFLRKFGLSSVHDLPPVSAEFLETLRSLGSDGTAGQMEFSFGDGNEITEVTL